MPPTTTTVALQGMLGEIAKRFGEASALRVAEELGGQSVHLPRKLSGSHPLARRVGSNVVRWLATEYGRGARISVPLGPASQRARRAQQIEALLGEGHSANEVARQVGCGVRTVYQHRARGAANTASSQAGVDQES